MKREDELSGKIIGCAIEVHRTFGPGLLESTYRDALLFELEERNIFVKKEQNIPLTYKGHDLKSSYRMDLIVEDKAIIELKAFDGLNDIHFAQTLTYLKLTNCKMLF
jgi:GxxExxY protein